MGGSDACYNIPNSEDGIDDIELVSLEVQIFLHTGNIGV